jgi:hypothetical protein
MLSFESGLTLERFLLSGVIGCVTTFLTFCTNLNEVSRLDSEVRSRGPH